MYYIVCPDHDERGIVEAAVETNSRLIPDGGEENNNDENNNEQNDEEENADEEGTTVLYLDLEGLFLDLLGLEVELEEIELDISAIPGSGNLLGNLLSAVAGLLDGGLSELLDGLLPGDGLPSLSDVLPDAEDVSELFFSVLNQLLDALIEALTETESSESNESSG